MKNIIRLILVLFSILILTNFMNATSIIDLNLYFFNDDVSINPSVIEDSNYNLEINSEKLECSVNFIDENNLMISTYNFYKKDAIHKYENSFASEVRVPYIENMKYVDLYCEDELIDRFELNLCNQNNVCEENENVYSCPSDCTIKTDNVCTAKLDNICDKGCLDGIDPDCNTNLRSIIIYSLVIVLVLLIGLFTYGRIRQNDLQ